MSAELDVLRARAGTTRTPLVNDLLAYCDELEAEIECAYWQDKDDDPCGFCNRCIADMKERWGNEGLKWAERAKKAEAKSQALGKLLDEAVEWVADAECMSPEDLGLRTDLLNRIEQERGQ